MTTRTKLLKLVADLGITDAEAGESQWAQYLSDQSLADAINRLRPGAGATASESLPEFRCPKCGGKYFGTVSLESGTVECHTNGCRWTGQRSECGL